MAAHDHLVGLLAAHPAQAPHRRERAVTGMTREQAIRCGFINPKQDKAHFDRMDVWPDDTEDALTLFDLAAATKRVVLRREAAKAKADAMLGKGTDVNSLSWREVMDNLEKKRNR